MDSSVFFGISTIAYILAMIAYIAYIVFKKQGVGIAATGLTVLGFVCQSLALLLRWSEFYDLGKMGILRAVPITNLYESLVFFVWCLILGYLIVEYKYKTRSFGAFVTPVAGLALAFIDLSGMSTEIQPLVPALQSNWLLVHVMMSFLAYSTFAIAFSTATMYLILTTDKRTDGSYIFWTVSVGLFVAVLAAMGVDFISLKISGVQARQAGMATESHLLRASFLSASSAVRLISYILLAAFVFVVWLYGGALKKIVQSINISPDVLDEITYKSIAVGFPIFTLGGLIFGAIWADQAWGVYWSWDPKETWSLITWFFYAFYLHARLLRGWRHQKTAIIAVLGFVAVIFTYLGVNLLLSGLHAYGSE